MLGNSFLYKLFKVPQNLVDLLNKADAEGEYFVHFLEEYSIVKEKHWTEIELSVRYWHGRAKREVTLLRADSREEGYRHHLDLQKMLAKDLIRELGHEVRTDRRREIKPRSPIRIVEA